MQLLVITMIRSVNDKERYYKIELIPNLFGEVLLIRTYGSVYRRKPTGVITQIYANTFEAVDAQERLINQKRKKGYCIA